MVTCIKKSYSFPKRGRMCLNKQIDNLFQNNDSFIVYPLRVIFQIDNYASNDIINSSVLITVGKKRLKRANKRNRIKRLIREAYRLNKHEILDKLKDENKKIRIAFLYLKNELSDYEEIENSVIKIFKTIENRLNAETIK